MKLKDIYMDFLFYKITRLGLLYITMENGLGLKCFERRLLILKIRELSIKISLWFGIEI